MQHCRAEASRTINASIDDIWATIEQMTGMEDWYAGLIASSDVDTTKPTPLRVCQMQGGGVLEERILLRDPRTHTFVYAIDSHPLPAKNVVGTLRVDPSDRGTVVTWDAQFTTQPETTAQMIEMITGIYRAGLDSLAAYHTP